jgi:outer membrane autotransporter protein
VLAFDRKNNLSYSGTISGTGVLIKNGIGTLTLTGENTFSGGTTIDAGILQIGNGGTQGSIVGDVVDNAVLKFNRGDDLVFDGVISGPGALIKSGLGTLTLTANNTYTGGTTVQKGALVVNGSLLGSISVLPGAYLEYNGNAGSTTVGGTLAPGHSIGTMTVNGDLTFGPDSLYEVEVSPWAADRTNVTGLATLNGTVHVIAEPGDYTPEVLYTILSAGSLSGTFTALTSDFASYTFIAPALTYDANNVYFSLARTATFASAGETANQIATGAAVDSLGYGNPLVQSVLYGTAGEARAAFDVLSGEVHASAVSAMAEETRYLRDAVLGRLYETYAEDRSGAWVQPLGARGDMDGDGNAATLSRSAAGLFAGLDTTIGAAWKLGAAGGYTQSWLDADPRAASGSSVNVQLALYGGRRFGPLGLRLGFGHAWQQLEISRQISYPGFADETSAEYSAKTTQLFGELGYGIALGRSSIEPFAGLSYIKVDTGHFGETGGDAALTGRSTFDTSIVAVGLRGVAPLMTTDRIQLALRGGLGWRHAVGNVAPEANLGFAAGGTPFVVHGAPIAKDALGVQAGIDIEMGPNARLSVLYDGQLAAGANDNGARLNLSLRF